MVTVALVLQSSKADEAAKQARDRESQLTQQLTKAEAAAKRAQQLEGDLTQQVGWRLTSSCRARRKYVWYWYCILSHFDSAVTKTAVLTCTCVRPGF